MAETRGSTFQHGCQKTAALTNGVRRHSRPTKHLLWTGRKNHTALSSTTTFSLPPPPPSTTQTQSRSDINEPSRAKLTMRRRKKLVASPKGLVIHTQRHRSLSAPARQTEKGRVPAPCWSSSLFRVNRALEGHGRRPAGLS